MLAYIHEHAYLFLFLSAPIGGLAYRIRGGLLATGGDIIPRLAWALSTSLYVSLWIYTTGDAPHTLEAEWIFYLAVFLIGSVLIYLSNLFPYMTYTGLGQHPAPGDPIRTTQEDFEGLILSAVKHALVAHAPIVLACISWVYPYTRVVYMVAFLASFLGIAFPIAYKLGWYISPKEGTASSEVILGTLWWIILSTTFAFKFI